MNCVRLITFFLISLLPAHALGWFDASHLAVAKVAGYEKWYTAVGADMAKIKAGSIEGYNHFYNNPGNITITPEFVLLQAAKYNDPRDAAGHLYGAIIKSLRNYRETFNKGKYSSYHLGFFVHYIADLSQPLHNMAYDDFNKQRHLVFDATVDREALQRLDKIRAHMYQIHLDADRLEQDLAMHVARIANISRELGIALKKDKRNMSKQEAYELLGHSASVLKAVLAAVRQ